MKIIIYSHPLNCQTGFGRGALQIASILSQNNDVVVCNIINNVGGPYTLNNIPHYPLAGNVKSTPKMLKHYATMLNADLIIQHFDVWMMESFWIDEMPCPVITYAPIDCETLPRNFKESCAGAFMNVGMTKYATKLMQEAGMPATYIPHFVDTSIFYPTDKSEAKKMLGVADDEFLVGLVATNGSYRKNIGGQIAAFADVNDTCKAKMKLYLHTNTFKVNAESVDITHLVERLGITDKVLIPNQEDYITGFPDQIMAMLYNAFDVLLQCTTGEGFGLPVIEAMACGTPVIGTYTPVMHELSPTSVLIDGARWYVPYYDNFNRIPYDLEITDAITRLHNEFNANGTCKIEPDARRYDFALNGHLWNDLITTI